MRSFSIKDSYDCELLSESRGSFILRFVSGDKTVSIHLEDWWIAPLADKFHAHIAKRQKELDSLKEALKGG